MSKKRKEHVLDDFFRVMHRYAKREGITEQRIAKLLKELHHLALEVRRLCRKGSVSGVRERQIVDPIRRHRRESLYKYIFLSPQFCSTFSRTSVNTPVEKD